MMIIRPLAQNDWSSLRAIAAQTGVGFTSLQDDDEQVRGKFDTALKSFDVKQSLEHPLFLFLMEDTDDGSIAGVCGIDAAIGLDSPWYNYHVGTLVHSSRELKVHNQVRTLTISNDYTGCSELCSLFLKKEHREGINGHLLSKSRFMFISEFGSRFDTTIMAEMRGVSDDNGVSPFWEGLGRHFFSIDFWEADQLSSTDKVFIAELMPKYPIYTNLLPESAQQAIGATHSATAPARNLLESEGLRYTNFVDIFDAGPVLEAQQNQIRIINDSGYAKVEITSALPEGETILISSTQFSDFRCTATKNVQLTGGKAIIEQTLADALHVKTGDMVRTVPLFAEWRAPK